MGAMGAFTASIYIGGLRDSETKIKGEDYLAFEGRSGWYICTHRLNLEPKLKRRWMEDKNWVNLGGPVAFSQKNSSDFKVHATWTTFCTGRAFMLRLLFGLHKLELKNCIHPPPSTLHQRASTWTKVGYIIIAHFRTNKLTTSMSFKLKVPLS